MMMTDREIVSSYNQAPNKREQVKILSELNACDEDSIKKILVENGVPETDFRVRKRRSRKTEKPNPAEAEPVSEEKLEIPFADDLEDCDYGAITGGEGDVEGYMGSMTPCGYEPPLRPYRSAEELLEEPADMTREEKERLARIKEIPVVVRDLCRTELETLHRQVMELERKRDAIADFLNGESA
jgi:hypothetical protein